MLNFDQILTKNFRDFPKMQHFSENYWKKRLAKTVFPGEKGKWPENGRMGKMGKWLLTPGKRKMQSSRFEIGGQLESFRDLRHIGRDRDIDNGR